MRRIAFVLFVVSGTWLWAAGRGPGAEIGSTVDRVTGPAVQGGSSLAKGIGGYVLGRVSDALDVFEANVAIGPGLKAGVEYFVLRTTLGYVHAQRMGFDSHQVGTWGELNVAYGIFPASLAFAPFELVKNQGEVWESLAVCGFELGSVGVERTLREDFATNAVLYREAVMAGPWHERRGDICSAGAEVHAGLIGARLRFKPLELVDFVLGFVGVDLDPQLGHPDPEGMQRR